MTKKTFNQLKETFSVGNRFYLWHEHLIEVISVSSGYISPSLEITLKNLDTGNISILYISLDSIPVFNGTDLLLSRKLGDHITYAHFRKVNND